MSLARIYRKKDVPVEVIVFIKDKNNSGYYDGQGGIVDDINNARIYNSLKYASKAIDEIKEFNLYSKDFFYGFYKVVKTLSVTARVCPEEESTKYIIEHGLTPELQELLDKTRPVEEVLKSLKNKN